MSGLSGLRVWVGLGFRALRFRSQGSGPNFYSSFGVHGVSATNGAAHSRRSIVSMFFKAARRIASGSRFEGLGL